MARYDAIGKNRMKTLDCETREAALESVAELYGVSVDQIDGFLKNIDLDAHYEKENPPRAADEEMTRLFEEAFSVTAKTPERVHWFHLTRTDPDNDFRDGILPLGKALPVVWDSVLRIFRNTPHQDKLGAMRLAGVPDFPYNLKTASTVHGGPFAMLVRESAFRCKEMGTHDYLWLPEIMEDICNGYQHSHGVGIHEHLCSALSPTIVKFWSDERRGRDCIESAMYYLYLTAHGEEMSIHSNTCFDGNNLGVPHSNIVSISVVNPKMTNCVSDSQPKRHKPKTAIAPFNIDLSAH